MPQARWRRLPEGRGRLAAAVAVGALLADGPGIRDMWRRAALQLARILKGEPVASMPIERPDRFRLAINLRTAEALGLKLPTTLRLLADEMFE